MTTIAKSNGQKDTWKVILFSALLSLLLAFLLLALGALILNKIQKSERFEPLFVFAVQLICGFVGGWLSSVSKQNCFLRAGATAATFYAAMFLLSLLFFAPPLPSALLSSLPIIPAGIAGGCVNALRNPRKKNRKLKRK